jgi:hypothetical protein
MLQDSLLTYQSPIVRAGQIDMMVNTVSRKDNFTSGLSDFEESKRKSDRTRTDFDDFEGQ